METEKEKITELTEETESPATENADRAIESETAKADNTEAKEELTPEQIKLKRKNDIIRILKFVGFSCSAGVIQFVVFTILNEVLHLIYWPAYLIALVLSVLWNFTFNRKFTFKSANNVPIAMLKVAAYYVVFTPLSTLWGDALTDKAHWNEYLVLAFTMVINLVTEYLFNQFVVYRKSMNTNDLGKKENAALEAAGKHDGAEKEEDKAEDKGDENA
ncbi:MAG: GtrA family protein [Firmicutes bacterium]|uniref:GtrA family protein n=1 Tax=Candidatus Stercoripulliclostridium pullicola TaxID=2840953 RepID=A0A940DGQ3_9FIRM|nr:GtrA family protein [Candidatus Stercoripulliclostridium pullicola]